MKKSFYSAAFSFALLLGLGCTNQPTLELEVYETSAAGNSLQLQSDIDRQGESVRIELFPDQKFQRITGFGGSFTESSAYLINQLSPEKRRMVINAYFGEEGAQYSLTRTHMNSCDFSLSNYSYAPVEGDVQLENFSIEEDRPDIIPFIQDAQKASTDGFKIISSPGPLRPG